MKPQHKMIVIFLLPFLLMLFAKYPECYPALLEIMDDWNWLLSGLSAGGFAVFFNWLISREKNSNHKKALISFVLIELSMNYSRTNDCMRLLHPRRHTRFHPFVNRHEWNNARQTLTYALPTGIITDIEFAYQLYNLLEDRLRDFNPNSRNELIDLYELIVTVTQNAITHLNREINENIELPPPIDFTQR